MESYIFIGEGFLPDMGIQPLLTPTTAGTTAVNYTKIKPYLQHLSKLASVRVIDSSGMFYHTLYRDETIEVVNGSVKTVKVGDLLANARRIDGDICSFLKSLPVIYYVYREMTSGFLPVIVKYTNSWEHISTAPIKLVKDSAEYYIYNNAVGIIVVRKEASILRPYMREILSKPTSTLLSDECGISLKPPKKGGEEKKSGIMELK